MKELRLPWSNWHSMAASIGPAVLAPDDPLRDEPLFTGKVGAEILETTIVRPGINRWNRTRLEKAISADGAQLSQVRWFLRQILETTTFNLASTGESSAEVTDDTVLRLPPTFFLNTEAFLEAVSNNPQANRSSVTAKLSDVQPCMMRSHI
jgi:hypothetical protein